MFIFVEEDTNGNLWVPNGSGLDLFDRKSKRFIHYRNQRENKQSLRHNMVESILMDRNGRSWIGTGSGLNLFDERTDRFTVYTEKEGLASNMIHAILEDRQEQPLVHHQPGTYTF